MPRSPKPRCWPTDTVGQRVACISAVAALLYGTPAAIALIIEHVAAFAR